ncbi:hypothetical protein [Brevifollis gellanilyticus]|uniref:Uncharacterized protein n=1 Tax=Brevifollis gellanilyticus TaxID=748831 RepID=A0A512MB37_9BACT|nr:hypothetical protein [Brevifollis gellanilyticus]GEP43938.1 hypothetical protein BGE01nite_32290 [Brevifollis gellanilyticus]
MHDSETDTTSRQEDAGDATRSETLSDGDLPLHMRPLPQWAWMLSVLVFPASVFLAFGAARLLSWSRALVLAVVSGVSSIGFVQLMVYLESHDVSWWITGLTNLAGFVMYLGWGFLIYRIGLRHGLWTPTARKLWRAIGWGMVGMIMLSAFLHLILAVLTLVRAWRGE